MSLGDLDIVIRTTECDLNQSNVDSFVARVAKNNSRNNVDCHRIFKIFLINCFGTVITLA